MNVKLQVDRIKEEYRNVRKTNWNKYREDLKENVKHINLGLDVDELETAITNAYHDNCRLKKSFGSNKPKWWNKDLDILKKTWRNGSESRLSTKQICAKQ